MKKCYYFKNFKTKNPMIDTENYLIIWFKTRKKAMEFYKTIPKGWSLMVTSPENLKKKQEEVDRLIFK